MTTFLRLADHIGYGLIGEVPIFLDLRRDRYLALTGVSASAFRRLVGGRPLSGPDIDMLLATNLFERAQDNRPIRAASATPPSEQIEMSGGMRAGVGDRLVVWGLLRRVGRELRKRPIFDLLDKRAADASCSPHDPARAAALALRFRSARRGAPVAPRCLPDSIALWDWLRARGASVSIVFGAKLDPFGAHCWVQDGTLALNEAIDRAGEYTPVYIFP